MYIKIKLFFFCLCLLPISLISQTEESETTSSFGFVINQDNVFGFWPQVFGSFPLKGGKSLTYYGVYWTNPAYGNLDLGGSDNWLETGIGVSFTPKESAWTLNPSLGFTHGKVISGGNEGIIGESIIPSVAAYYATNKWDIEIFGAYYKALRKEGDVTTDYLFYWALPGYKLNDRLAIGAHVEGFIVTRETGGTSYSLYNWLGAFVKFNTNEQYYFRFSAGANLSKDFYSREFYKLSAIFYL